MRVINCYMIATATLSSHISFSAAASTTSSVIWIYVPRRSSKCFTPRPRIFPVAAMAMSSVIRVPNPCRSRNALPSPLHYFHFPLTIRRVQWGCVGEKGGQVSEQFSIIIKRKVGQAIMIPIILMMALTSSNTITIAASGETT